MFKVAICDLKLGRNKIHTFCIYRTRSFDAIERFKKRAGCAGKHIQIMRVYSKMKELLIIQKAILMKLEHLEKKTDKHDEQVDLIFSYI